MNEEEKIIQRYEARKIDSIASQYSSYPVFSKCIVAEKEKKYNEILQTQFLELTELKILEIGAGYGTNLAFFNRLGVPYSNLVANELLNERHSFIKNKFPQISVHGGNALNLPFENEFDVVFQSVVFTSILDPEVRVRLADKMWKMAKPAGIILWYDFIYNNPGNPDVRGVPKKEIQKLFHNARSIRYHRVTLAPPIGRRVGRMYDIINSLFPFLRTHVIAVIRK